MNRLASTRSEYDAVQPRPAPAQWSVGSIDADGIRYGFTTHSLIARTIATAPTIVTTQSIATRHGRGRRCVSLSTGFLTRRPPFVLGSAPGATPRCGRGRPTGARPGRA